MTKKIAITAIVAYCIGFMLGPPDLITMFLNGLIAAFLCALPLLILARFGFVKSASRAMHTLTCVLVGMVALLSLECYVLNVAVAHQTEPSQEPTTTSSSPTTQSRQVASLAQEN